MKKNNKNTDTQRGTNPLNRDVNAAQRATMAVQLRATKMTYAAIAQQCGFANASSCRKAIMRELDRCVVRDVETLRLEECAMLDQLQQEVYKRLTSKEHEKVMLFAVDRLLQISERRSKLLGLDTPVDSAALANVTIIREVPVGLLPPPEGTP